VTELAVTEFRRHERLSRQQAAERLIDIAYSLTAGGPLELIAAGRRITVPVDKELRLERWLRSNGGRVELALALSWPAPEAGLSVAPLQGQPARARARE
jgi:amphi-Trp domain-containing protein